MTIVTSYYANLKNIPDDYIKVSISGQIPEYIQERVDIQDKRLAPNWDLFKEYKNSDEGLEREIQYIKRFKNEVLPIADFYEIIKSWSDEVNLDKKFVLMCYETPYEFCHRHIVAEAIEEKYNIEVKELGVSPDYIRKNYSYKIKDDFKEDEW